MPNYRVPQVVTPLGHVHLSAEGGGGQHVVQGVDDLVVDAARLAEGVLSDIMYCT